MPEFWSLLQGLHVHSAFCFVFIETPLETECSMFFCVLRVYFFHKKTKTQTNTELFYITKNKFH